MGHPGLDAEAVLVFIQTLLYWITWILGGSGLLAFCAYVVFLCWEIFSPLLRSKARLARVPQRASCASVAEENLDLFAAERPILAETESLGEAVPVSALPHDAQMPVTLVPVTPHSEPAVSGAFLTSCDFGGSSPEAPFQFES